LFTIELFPGVTANLKTQTENDTVEIKAKTGHLACHIYAWEWQEKNTKNI